MRVLLADALCKAGALEEACPTKDTLLRLTTSERNIKGEPTVFTHPFNRLKISTFLYALLNEKKTIKSAKRRINGSTF